MRNKIKHILTVCFVIAAMAVVWNAPVWAGTATQAELTGTQEDIELNKEVTINWEKNGSTVDYYFTPTENKRYLFVLTDNDDRFPGLYQGDDKLSWFSYYSTVDGKMYLQTPVLEAGTKYDIYFTSREGETEIQFGFYDDIWHGAEEMDNSVTGIMKKGYIDDGTNYSRCKIYKITVPEDGAYEYRVSGLNPTGIADDDYDFDVDIYDEDGNWNSNQDSVPNWGGSSDACAFANLEAGKTYYLVLANYSVDNAYEYTLSRTNLGIELNSEKTLNWNEIGDYFYYHFIPEKTQSYLFTVSDNGDRVPQIGRTDETWKKMMYDVDGKLRLVTPVLEAGKEYTLYVPIAAGENSVQIGYYDQEHHVLHAEKTIFEEISDTYPTLTETQIRNMLAAFLFTGDDVFKVISSLSGGERGRVSLAKLMLSEANFLILDEPTNHLDIASKEILEEALNSYTGTVLYVSHDRYFINQTATRILDLTNQSVVNYIGDYDYYLEKKEELTEKYAPSAQEATEETKEETPSEGKLTWQQQKEEQARKRKQENELKKVEKRIEELETRDKEIDDTLVLPDVCTNVGRCAELSREKDKIQAELEELYEKWEELA